MIVTPRERSSRIRRFRWSSTWTYPPLSGRDMLPPTSASPRPASCRAVLSSSATCWPKRHGRPAAGRVSDSRQDPLADSGLGPNPLARSVHEDNFGAVENPEVHCIRDEVGPVRDVENADLLTGQGVSLVVPALRIPPRGQRAIGSCPRSWRSRSRSVASAWEPSSTCRCQPSCGHGWSRPGQPQQGLRRGRFGPRPGDSVSLIGYTTRRDAIGGRRGGRSPVTRHRARSACPTSTAATGGNRHRVPAGPIAGPSSRLPRACSAAVSQIGFSAARTASTVRPWSPTTACAASYSRLLRQSPPAHCAPSRPVRPPRRVPAYRHRCPDTGRDPQALCTHGTLGTLEA